MFGTGSSGDSPILTAAGFWISCTLLPQCQAIHQHKHCPTHSPPQKKPNQGGLRSSNLCQAWSKACWKDCLWVKRAVRPPKMANAGGNIVPNLWIPFYTLNILQHHGEGHLWDVKLLVEQDSAAFWERAHSHGRGLQGWMRVCWKREKGFMCPSFFSGSIVGQISFWH